MIANAVMLLELSFAMGLYGNFPALYPAMSWSPILNLIWMMLVCNHHNGLFN
jgi:hypothetical protein